MWFCPTIALDTSFLNAEIKALSRAIFSFNSLISTLISLCLKLEGANSKFLLLYLVNDRLKMPELIRFSQSFGFYKVVT